MRGPYVELTVNGPGQFTEALSLEPRTVVAVAIVPSSFAGTVVLQRSLDGTSWMDVDSWVDSAVQGSYDVDVAQLLRMGVATGKYALGTVYLRLDK